MPVWHEKTAAWRKSGKLTVVGITQEQHAARCRLFAQWHGIDWPILWDPFNRTGSKVVPRFTLIDENGVVRSRRPNPDDLEAGVQESNRTLDANIKDMESPVTADEITTVMGMIADEPLGTPSVAVSLLWATGVDDQEEQSTAVPERLVKARLMMKVAAHTTGLHNKAVTGALTWIDTSS